ncbi:MAG: hypothetical protein VX815_13220 [Gemmatimonadota bacterium]|nr:hypothetical protein [Gemmatimonadota bacterium]
MQKLAQAAMYGSVLVAVIATAAPDVFAYFALVLVLLGLVWGFMQPMEDASARVVAYVLAAALPRIADNLDVIPVIGAYADGFLDQIAVFIAGVAIANLLIVMGKGLRDA